MLFEASVACYKQGGSMLVLALAQPASVVEPQGLAAARPWRL